MNYEPNTIPWRHGDIVIHDAAAKEPRMLMRVQGIQRDGLYRTQYIDRRQKRTMWVNDLASLHDPALFGIDTTSLDQKELERYQFEFEMVQRWNRNHHSQFVALYRESRPINFTTTFAYIEGHRAFVTLAYGGRWPLRLLNIVPGIDDLDTEPVEP